MSRLDVTTQDLFLRLDKNSRSRSAKADAVFRRLRLESEDQIADALMRAPRALTFNGKEEAPQKKRRKSRRQVKQG